MLKELFFKQKEYIDYFFDKINLREAEDFFKCCLECKGLIILSGVGKSGIVAEKIATTMTSSGTRAIYLSPINFLHGDIGIFSPDDILIFLSKSGETEELLTLIPFLKKRGVKLLSIVSNPDSRLAKESFLSLTLPLVKELCPFNLVPTTSTALQMIFGDILSVALMRAKNFDLSMYALNHPLGEIGRKISLKVNDIMLKEENLPIVREDNLLHEVLVELSLKKSGCLIVVDNQADFKGIFTDGDLRRALQNYGQGVLNKPMKELMTTSAIVCPNEQMLVWDALGIMQKDPRKWITVLPVLDKHKLIGLIRMHDIIQRGFSIEF